VGQPDGVRVVDQCAEEAVTGRQLPDLGGLLVGDPDMDELLEVAARGDDAQGTIPGADEVDGDVDDAAQDRCEVEFLDDGLAGLQQAAQAPLGGQHLLGVDDEFGQRLVEG
jgi:hypothetical protein